MTHRIFTVVGARPQFVKASVVSRAIASSQSLSETLVHTGQHFDANMSQIFFDDLGIPAPDRFLDIHGGSHGQMTGRMLTAIEELLLEGKPDAVLVYGDTNSTLAGALAAAKLHIPVAHVEAGLRSFNMRMPEEINRILTDRMSRWLFVPTRTAEENLAAEGYPDASIHQVGDVMFDVARRYSGYEYGMDNRLSSFEVEAGNFVLVTVHRAENTDDLGRLRAIIAGLVEVSATIDVIWPVHPRTRQIIEREFDSDKLGGLRLIDPVGFLEMLALEKGAALIATDSGGVQKEAYFQRVPCVTLRDETEWTELVEAGWNRLAPPVNAKDVSAAIRESIGSSGDEIELYGDGNASGKICDILERSMNEREG